ncbi:MAG: HypC/HybG/HupF family hydrogenase formation chaperone [Candidatus Dormibacteria bacterium]|jgi:hydrogenase maturation factor
MDGVNQNGGAGADPAAPTCHEEVCITCSDQAVPRRVIELGELGTALVGTEAFSEEISVALVDAGPGDTVLVHAGEAIAVVARA